MNNYSTKRVSDELIKEIVEALKNIRGWGSIEIIVQDFKVVQITERNIRKTNNPVLRHTQEPVLKSIAKIGA